MESTGPKFRQKPKGKKPRRSAPAGAGADDETAGAGTPDARTAAVAVGEAPRVLVLDVGGTNVKLLASGQSELRKLESGPTLTPLLLVEAVQKLTSDWSYDVVSIGYPGVVLEDRVIAEPHNLGPGWVGFDFARAFGRPVRMLNDAAMQALGSYCGGRMLFLGLGTGLGSALISDGALVPLELAHLPYRRGRSYEDYVGLRGLRRLGKPRWRSHVAEVVGQLRAALECDEVVLGGGNARRLKVLPEGSRLGDNANAFIGGFRMWDPAAAARAPSPGSQPRVRLVQPAPGAPRPEAVAAPPAPVVFLLDVDNTLLDNDRVSADLRRYLREQAGPERAERYWEIFEELRGELGYADYLGALQRFRVEHRREPHLLAVSSFLVNYPFANRLFPGSLDVLDQLAGFGPTVLLSDGDVVFQPRKIERAGLADAVAGRVLLYIHKEQELDDVEARFPAERYVLIDDKIRILTAVKKIWGDRVFTVFPRQGHYATAVDVIDYPPADLAVERIADLLQEDWARLLGVARRA